MNELKIFDYQGKTIRTHIDDSGAPWLVAKDVCEGIGLMNVSQALARLDDDEQRVITSNDVVGRPADFLAINESGLYCLVLGSRKLEAKKFKKWITSEVLPSIRKTGSYSMRPLSIDERLTLALAAEVDTRKQILEVKTELSEVRNLAIQASSHNSANTGFMTLRGYCNIYGVQLSLKQSQAVGKACATLTRCIGGETRKTDDEMFGRVNSYPMGVLHEVFKDLKPELM